MTALLIIFLLFLFYVSYCKIIYLLFRGKQHNRFFAAFINTVVPVIGSVPAYIMATKFEKRIGGIASKMNENIVRYVIIVLQIISVFLLFFPFFNSGGIYATGINLIFGHEIAGSDVMKPTKYMLYLIAAPYFAAYINAIDVNHNIRNVITYTISLFICVTLSGIVLVMGTDDIVPMPLVWIYCIMQVVIMLLSINSLISIRNAKLADIEKEEQIDYIKSKRKENEANAERKPGNDFYRCAKCGNFVKKGTVCNCRSEQNKTLNTIMVDANREKSNEYCVYCRRPLKSGEKCNCTDFGITVKPKSINGRKCPYCGQMLVGDSVCVCEKIMKNSKPVPGDDSSPMVKTYTETKDETSAHFSDEMAQLQKMIDSKLSSVKQNLESSDVSAVYDGLDKKASVTEKVSLTDKNDS